MNPWIYNPWNRSQDYHNRSQIYDIDLGSIVIGPILWNRDLQSRSLFHRMGLYMQVQTIGLYSLDPRDRSQNDRSRIIDPRSYHLGLYHGSYDLYHGSQIHDIDHRTQILYPRIQDLQIYQRQILQIQILGLYHGSQIHDIGSILGCRIYILDWIYRSRIQDVGSRDLLRKSLDPMSQTLDLQIHPMMQDLLCRSLHPRMDPISWIIDP